MRRTGLGILIFILLASACKRQRNEQAYDYFPDMVVSTAYETNSDNPFFADSMTMRVPPAGSVPRDYVPFDYTPDPEARKKAGDDLENPIIANDENIAEGKKQYNIFCAVCHGFTGTGDGKIFKMGLYPARPRPLSGAGANPLRDGEIYHTITLGFISMGPYGTQVRPDERWKIILYIRQLNKDAADTTGKK